MILAPAPAPVLRRNPFTMPDKVAEVLLQPAPYKVLKGGRGSAKSWGVAEFLVTLASFVKVRVLCTRELQVSIADSVYKLLADWIERKGMTDQWAMTKTSLINIRTGSEFMFKGLRHNIREIKGMEGINICWVEEAQVVSEESWEILLPTIRQQGSEVIITFNPDSEDDPTWKRFVSNQMPGQVGATVNWNDNQYFPDVLRVQMEYMKRVDYDAYLHIWEGQPRGRSKAQVLFGKYVVDVFDRPADVQRVYYGADWGFAQDPSTLIAMWIKDRKLFIEYEAYGIGVELDQLSGFWHAGVPGCRTGIIKADNSRPETINHMAKQGWSCRAAAKWPGCVEDGVAFLRAFEQIVIHERCKHTIEEARLYSYKVDAKTQEVLPVILDRHNHCIDAIRYGLDGLIQRGTTGLLEFYADQAAEKAAKDAADKAAQISKFFPQ